MWLPHNVLLADEDWIDELVSAIEKVQSSADTLVTG
jgi:hypothetical protein